MPFVIGEERKGTLLLIEINAKTLYLLSPSFNTFTYTGLTSTLLSYMQKWAWLKAWSQISYNTAPLLQYREDDTTGEVDLLVGTPNVKHKSYLMYDV